MIDLSKKLNLIRGDCLEVLRELPDKSVDLVLTDPPYGKQWSRGENGIGLLKKLNTKYEDVKWDSEIPSKEYFDEMLRVGKNVIVFGGNYFTDYLPASNCWLVWDKLGNFPKSKDSPFAHCELVWTNFNKTVKKYTWRVQGFIKDSKDKRFHPTQKPTELIEEILTDFSVVGDLVLDCFMGSGTTGVASLKLGRRFIGIELDEKYFGIAKERCSEWENQSRLF